MTANLSNEEIAGHTTQGQVSEKLGKLVHSTSQNMLKESPKGHPDDLAIILYSGKQEEFIGEKLEEPLKK